MDRPLFTGVCTALVTPFLHNKINYPMLQQLIRRQENSGIHTLVLAGTTGEAPTLSDREKLELFEKARQYASSDTMIIAGTGSNCTAHAVELSKAAESAGANALLVVSPYYNKANPEGLFAHYLSIAHATTLPIILYNVPSRTGLDMPVSVYKRLSKIPNIVGVKEASSDITKITKIRNACGPGFTVWSGNDDQAVPAISLGAMGLISVVSNVAPFEALTLCEAALAGDADTALQMQSDLQTLTEALFCEVNPIPVKAAMELIGYDCGPCRLPLGKLSKDNYQHLKELLIS